MDSAQVSTGLKLKGQGVVQYTCFIGNDVHDIGAIIFHLTNI